MIDRKMFINLVLLSLSGKAKLSMALVAGYTGRNSVQGQARQSIGGVACVACKCSQCLTFWLASRQLTLFIFSHAFMYVCGALCKCSQGSIACRVGPCHWMAEEATGTVHGSWTLPTLHALHFVSSALQYLASTCQIPVVVKIFSWYSWAVKDDLSFDELNSANLNYLAFTTVWAWSF